MDRLREQEIEEMRRATPEEKARQVLDLMETGIRLERSALRARHPDETEAQIEARMDEWLAGGDD